MKRILITGGSHAELPLIQAAQRLGLYTITTGNNPEGLGHQAADRYVPADFSDQARILQLARDEQVDGIISGCNDFAYLSAAYACAQLGFPGHDAPETAAVIHSKDKFRAAMRQCGLRTPRTAVCTSEADVRRACAEIGLPIVIKPVDLTGGKGVMICKDAESACQQYRAALAWSRQTRVLAEEFISGGSYGASVILKEHRVIAAVFGNELYYLNPYLVSGACTAADLSAAARERLCRDIETLSQSLGLCGGLFHTQFVLDADGVPVMIDPCRRAPGDLYIRFAQYVTGIDFADLIVRSELGMPLPEIPQAEERFIARMCIMTDGNGRFGSIRMDSDVKEHLIDSLIWAKPDEPIRDYLKYKAGIVFLEYPDAASLYAAYRDFHSLVQIDRKELD